MTAAYLSSNALLSSWLFWTVASKTALSPRKSSVCFSSSLTRLWLLCHSFFMVARFSFRAVTCMVSLVSFSSCFRFSSSLSFFSVCYKNNGKMKNKLQSILSLFPTFNWGKESYCNRITTFNQHTLLDKAVTSLNFLVLLNASKIFDLVI